MPDIIVQIFQVCIIPLLGILTKYLIDCLSAKRDELNSKTDNEIAQRLYQSLGFKGNFIRKDYYQDTHTDAMNMVLWLKPHQIKRKKFTF